MLVNRYIRPSTSTADSAVRYLDNHDETVMQALITAGAFVAFADGRVEAIERDELVTFVDRQGFVPSISRQEIAEAFDHRVRQLQDRDSAEVIVETLRPLAGLSLASIVIRTATQVAAADRYIDPGELRALKLIRMVLLMADQSPPPIFPTFLMNEPGGPIASVSKAKREQVAELSSIRDAAKANKARKKKAVKPIDQERLMEAIRYLKEHPSGK